MDMDGTGSRLKRFESWLVESGITWNRESIEFVRRRRGFSVIAKSEVGVGERLACVPQGACLTARNCSVSEEISRRRLRGGLALSVAVAAERAKGEESRWHAYLEAMELPDVPLLWDPKELEMLEGTEIGGVATKDKEWIEEDYENVFKEVVPDLKLSEAIEAICLFSSRAFGASAKSGGRDDEVRDVEGASNEVQSSPSYVSKEKGRAAMHTDVHSSSGWPCHASTHEMSHEEEFSEQHHSRNIYHDGQEQTKEHLYADAFDALPGIRRSEVQAKDAETAYGSDSGESSAYQSDSDASDLEQEDALVPIADMFNHRVAVVDPPPEYQVVMEGGGQGTHLHVAGRECLPSLQIGILEEGNALVIVALQGAVRGSEIWNTYGELGNAELLNRYGFTLVRNPFDSVHVNMQDMMNTVRSRFGERWLRHRMRLLKTLIGDLDSPFEIMADGSLEERFQVALELLHAPMHVISALETSRGSITALLQDGVCKDSHEALRMLVQMRLEGYGRSLRQDLLLYERARPRSRLYNALALSISEKQILKRALTRNVVKSSDNKKRRILR